MKLICVVADLQIPYHDKSYVKAVKNFISALKPDEVGQIGDFLDEPQPSRWSKGRAGEYAKTLQADIDEGNRILDDIHFDWIKYGNHDLRVEEYVSRYAPALDGLAALKYESLLRLDDHGTRLERQPFTVAPGWVAAHGHEGSLSPISGRTAYSLAQRYDRSVLCGHTHRAGIVSSTRGFGNSLRVLTGFEVGHGMDVSRASYMKGQTADWQQAFGLLWVEGNFVKPELVPVVRGRFIVNGKEYRS